MKVRSTLLNFLGQELRSMSGSAADIVKWAHSFSDTHWLVVHNNDGTMSKIHRSNLCYSDLTNYGRLVFPPEFIVR